jgi:hypothetical protein
MGEHGFDVLAGAETVDAEIHAGAGGDRRLAECAQLDDVGAAAARTDLVTAKDMRAGVAEAHARLLFLRTETAPQPLVLVGRPPIVLGREGRLGDVRTEGR